MDDGGRFDMPTDAELGQDARHFVTGHPAHAVGSTWSLLDLTPLGRHEDWEDSPAGPANSWAKLDDEYATECSYGSA